MDKGELLQDSVKKLLSLGVSDGEIAESLAEVGVAKEDALKLINEVRAGAVQKKPASPDKTFETTAKELGGVEKPVPQSIVQSKPSSKPTSSKKISPLEVDFGIEMKESSNEKEEKTKTLQPESVVEQIVAQTTARKKVPVVPKPVPLVTEEIKEKETVPEEAGAIADKILEEVSKGQAVIDAVAATEKTALKEEPKSVKDKIKLSDVKQSDIEELWKKGIVIAINAKLDDMRKLKDEIDDEIGGKVDAAVKKETNQLKVLLDSQKDLIVSSNKEALMEKQKEITFIIDAKIAELKKYNGEIEENIRLIQQTKGEQETAMKELNEMLDNVKKTKTNLVMEMNSELIKSKSQAQEFVDKSEKHIKEMDERINKTLELEKNIAEGMLEKAEQKIEDLTIAKADDLIQELQVELNKVKAVEKSVSIETLDEKIKTLDKFKSEFLNSMQDNLTKINEAIEKLNSKNDTVEKELKGRMLIFDAKIEELTKFEKEFGKTMETYLEKGKK